MYRPKINYNISVYNLKEELIKEFHSKSELEYWLKDELNGSHYWLDVPEKVEIKLDKDLVYEDETVEALADMSADFLFNYWNKGCMGCQDFYYKIKSCCDKEIPSFENLIWGYNN